MKKGIPISPGIAVAAAYPVDQIFAPRESIQLDTTSLSTEIRRFEDACVAAADEIETISSRVREQVGEKEAEIFQAQKLMVQDPTLVAKVRTGILNRRVDAASALQDVLEEYTDLFGKIQDEYLKERLSDLRDVLGRIFTHLSIPANQKAEEEKIDVPVVIVAHEILPSQAMLLNRLNIAGIVTEVGGPSGHAAILARALAIPAVSGLKGIMDQIKKGDLLAVDGREGHIYIHPGPEVEAAYRKLQREYVDLRDRLIENRDHPPIAADGTSLELLANVNGPADARTAAKAGASGVGLYRTEFLFLSHPSVPDEDDQLAIYRDVIDAAPNNTVTIRTLDLGGDKHVPYLGEARETNPFLGWRSIRLSTAHPEFFLTQLRAILRAATTGKVSLLFPMVSTLEEILRLKKLVVQAEQTLQEQGLEYGKNIPIGVMVEVPAAALSIHSFLDEVDFISIGSNDLIQYIMAADRDNPKVAHLCEPFNPAVLKILHHIIKACNKHDKPVTLCGEMAGRPRCFLPLFGMGLKRFSMSPAFVPTIKEMVFSAQFEVARKISLRALRLKKTNQVRGYLTRKTQEICPNVARLDTKN